MENRNFIKWHQKVCLAFDVIDVFVSERDRTVSSEINDFVGMTHYHWGNVETLLWRAGWLNLCYWHCRRSMIVFDYFLLSVQARAFLENHSLVFCDTHLVDRTDFHSGTALHGLDCYWLDIDSRREYSPCQRIESLLEPILDFELVQVLVIVIADSQESVTAARLEVNCIWVEANLSQFLLSSSSEREIQKTDFSSVKATFLRA